MKRKIIYFLLALVVFGSSNTVEAKSKDDSSFNDRIIISLKKKYSKTDTKNIENALKVKVKNYRQLKTGKNVYAVFTKTKIVRLSSKLNVLNKNKSVKNAQPSFKYSFEPKSEKKITRAVSDDWHVKQTKADQLKSQVSSTSKVKVGVIDTGIDYDHPALKNNINKNLSYNFIGREKNAGDDGGHGTHVSGLIGADNDYSIGKNIELVALRALNMQEGSTEDIIDAIAYANKNNIKILNMSFDSDEYDDIMYDAIANYNGLAVICAGNNDNDSASFPASFELDNIISVGALDKSGNRANFSNYSNKNVDIFAPGQDVYSTCSISLMYCGDSIKDTHDEDNIVSKMSGTSMATPIVAGIAGTIYSQNPKMSMVELKNAVIDGAVSSKSLQNKATTNGYIDALQTLNYTKNAKTNATHHAKLNADGTLKLWGNNEVGQLGNSNNNTLTEADSFKFSVNNDKITKYYLTKENTYALTAKGDLYATGKNNFNQLGQKTNANSNKFVKFNKLSSSHIFTNVSFRNGIGLYDENSLKIELKNSKKSSIL